MSSQVNVLVLSKPAAHLRPLDSLKAAAHFTIGTDAVMLAEAAPRADVILNGMFSGHVLREAFPLANNVQWCTRSPPGSSRSCFRN
jgi:hypothetical protein